MKTSLLIIFAFTFLFTSAQNHISDSLVEKQDFKMTSLVEDTLWVMDSSEFYSTYNNSFQLMENYKVLNRDKNGNPLTGIARKRIPYLNFQDSYFDSITYFNNTNQVQVKKRLGWNILEQKWMDDMYFLYDNKRRLLEAYSKHWDVVGNIYGEHGSRRTYTYDTSFTRQITDRYLPEDNSWVHLKQYTVFNKDTNNIAISLTQTWDEGDQQWVNELKQVRHIFDDIRTSDLYNYVWDIEQQEWINSEYHHYVHNEQSGIDSSSVYLWNAQQNVWEKSRMSIYKLNENYKPVYYKRLVVDTLLNTWINEYKAEYEYYELGHNTIYYLWNTISNEWYPTGQSINSFNSDSTNYTYQYEEWDTLLQQWNAVYRIVSTFDARHNQTEETTQEWETDSELWETRNKAVYHWSAFVPQLIPTTGAPEVRIYPNPAANLLHIIFTSSITNCEATIYDVGGRAVLTTTIINPETQLDISNLKKGVYFLSIETKKGIVLKKLVKN